LADVSCDRPPKAGPGPPGGVSALAAVSFPRRLRSVTNRGKNGTEWLESQRGGSELPPRLAGTLAFGCSLATDVVIVARLAILVDVIAIAAGIAIILPAPDHRAENAAENGAGDRAADRAHTWKNGAGNCAADRADRRAGGDAPALAVVIIAAVVAVRDIIAVLVVIAVIVSVSRTVSGAAGRG